MSRFEHRNRDLGPAAIRRIRSGIVLLTVAATTAVGASASWPNEPPRPKQAEEPPSAPPGTSEVDDRSTSPTPANRVVRLEQPDQLTEEMREWARLAVGGRRDPLVKLRTLLQGLLGAGGLEIQYASDYTGTAAEVFETREANCLSFTHLFVALAREVGVDAYYVTVDEISSYAKKGDLVVVSNHITAGFGPAHERTILDFTVRPDVDYQTAQRVTDRHSYALYHSNRGAERMQLGDLPGAIDEFVVALEIEPKLPEAWSNLGVVRRRQGDHKAASLAYEKAIEADPQYFPVYQNLLALYQLEGRGDAAEELVRLLDRRRNRNPFSYLVLGDFSLEARRPDEAKIFYRRARRLGRNQADPLAALGQLALFEGDRRDATKWLEKAQRLDPASQRVRALEESLVESAFEGDVPEESDPIAD